MEKKVLVGRQLRERALLLWMPWVMVVMLTVLFGALGGGKGRAAAMAAAGFLKRLPGAIVAPVTRLDKMGYYELAKRDSMEVRQRLAMQANYARQLGLDGDVGHVGVVGDRGDVGAGRVGVGREHVDVGGGVDPNVVRIRQKLEQVRKAIGSADGGNAVAVARPAQRLAPAAGRLQAIMSMLQRDGREEGGNSELHELTSVVEKLLALQRSGSDTVKKVAPPRPLARPVLVMTALPVDGDTAMGFDGNRTAAFDSSRIEAVIPEETVLSGGGEIRLVLAQDVRLDRSLGAVGTSDAGVGQRIPAGTPVFGTAVLSGERLRIGIPSIAFEGKVFLVDLEVSDEDGMAGVYIPGAPVSEAVRESAGQEIGALGSGMVSTTLAGQAAGAGVVLARSLIGKKIRPVRVTVPAGYQVLLHVKNAGL